MSRRQRLFRRCQLIRGSFRVLAAWCNSQEIIGGALRLSEQVFLDVEQSRGSRIQRTLPSLTDLLTARLTAFHQSVMVARVRPKLSWSQFQG